MLTQFIINASTPEQLDFQMQASLDAGINWIEINADASVSDTDITDSVEKFRPRLEQGNVVVILADRYELVPKIKVDGVHMRNRSLPISKIRVALEAWPILGVSVSSAEDAEALRGLDIDYLYFSPAMPAGLDSITAIAAMLEARGMEMPLVAGGGIGADSVMKVIEAGAKAIAIDASIAADPAALSDAIKEVIARVE